MRGIVVGDVFRRLTRTMAQQFSKFADGATHPFQHALSTRAGTECVTHIVQALTSENSETTILSVDGIGAYDLISRDAISQGVRDMVDGDKMIPFIRQFYGSPSTFLWDDDFGEVHHMRNLDDVYVICRPSRVQEVFQLLETELRSRASISIHLGKTKLWNAGGLSPQGWQVSLQLRGCMIHKRWCARRPRIAHSPARPQNVGAPVGHPDFIRSFCPRKGWSTTVCSR